MVHMRSQSVIDRVQITHTCRWHTSEELHGRRFFVNVAAIILSYEQKTNLRNIWGCFGHKQCRQL